MIRFNKESERVSFDNSRELKELEQVIDEETQKAKFDLIKEVEDEMEVDRKHFLEVFEEVGINDLQDLVLPISEMDWF